MSKPIARVALITLLSLALIAAAYMTAQGAFAKGDVSRIQAHEVSGLQTNLNHYRSNAAEVQSVQLQADSQFLDKPSGHHCDSEYQSVPQD
jgi:hypothetical protein